MRNTTEVNASSMMSITFDDCPGRLGAYSMCRDGRVYSGFIVADRYDNTKVFGLPDKILDEARGNMEDDVWWSYNRACEEVGFYHE